MGKSNPNKDEREKSKEKAAKLLAKLHETPEERRNRRLEKKKRKQEKKEKKQKEQEELLGGYTNEVNPFGDTNLTEKFVWKLKREKEIESGLNPDELDHEREKQRRLELKREIAKVKERREKREIEKQREEEERAKRAREMQGESFMNWEKKEQEFHLKQAKDRSEIRIREGRPKPIDILYKNLSLDSDFDYGMNEPYKIFQGLSLAELEELHKDIQMYLELDSHKEFWQAMVIVCEDNISELRKFEEEKLLIQGNFPSSHRRNFHSGSMNGNPLLPNRQSVDFARQFEGGVHQEVATDIASIFAGKSYAELCRIHDAIHVKINSGNAHDVEYWDAIAKRLVVFKAKAKLREIHQDLLKKNLANLQSQQEMQSAEMQRIKEEDRKIEIKLEHHQAYEQPFSNPENPKITIKQEKEEAAAAEEEEEEKEMEDADVGEKPHEEGSYSPEIIHNYDETEEVVDADADLEQLNQQRREILEKGALKLQERSIAVRPTDRILTEEDMYRREAEKLMEENEEPFNLEIPLENRVYWWHDKYRPRKPKYFNRIHTGYEWNKYNQTHYDHDNPPPKIVQGYKFNIFYPDLIDKTKAPQYHIEPTDPPDTCILRFHAGPPYEDIAFKIVHKEWEYSHKKGFKCTFERGILHLWFNFKRYRYRR